MRRGRRGRRRGRSGRGEVGGGRRGAGREGEERKEREKKGRAPWLVLERQIGRNMKKKTEYSALSTVVRGGHFGRH